MKVCRQVLIDNSKVFKASLTRWAESRQTVTDIQVDSITGIEVVLRVIHDKLIESSYAIQIPEIWFPIHYCCNERDIDLKKLNGWFATVIEKKELAKLDHEQMRMLLFPS